MTTPGIPCEDTEIALRVDAGLTVLHGFIIAGGAVVVVLFALLSYHVYRRIHDRTTNALAARDEMSSTSVDIDTPAQ